ncbi:MAG: hypothetical protein RL151_581 [Bacteroidota bacterium]
MAYAEQVGVYLQRGGNIGEITHLYTRIGNTKGEINSLRRKGTDPR